MKLPEIRDTWRQHKENLNREKKASSIGRQQNTDDHIPENSPDRSAKAERRASNLERPALAIYADLTAELQTPNTVHELLSAGCPGLRAKKVVLTKKRA